MLRRTFSSDVQFACFGRVLLSAVLLVVTAAPCGIAQEAPPVDPETGYLFTLIPSTIDERPQAGIDERDRDAQRLERDRQSRARRLRTETNRKIGNVLNGSVPVASEPMFDAWFQYVIFAEMTQLDDKALGEIPMKRQRFFNLYMQRRNMPTDVHQRLVGLTLNEMRKIVRGNYHPAARINAMLIIGNLNFAEAVSSGTAKSPPVPLPEGLNELMFNYQDPNQIDSVRVAALVGIRRHAQLDGQFTPDRKVINPDVRNPIVDAMLALINQTDPPVVKTKEPDIQVQRSLSGHRWMQLRAIEILGAFREIGRNNAVAQKLESIFTDENAPLSFRCAAAKAYGQLNFDPDSVDPSESTFKVANLVAQGCRHEIARLVARLANEGHDDLNDIPRRVDAYYLSPSRRVVKQYILCAQEGVGLEPDEGLRQHATDEAKKAFVEKIAERLDKLMEATDPTRDDERKGTRFEVRRFKAYVEHQLALLDQDLLAFRSPDGVAPAGGRPGDPAPVSEVPADALPILPGGPPLTPGLTGP